MICTDDVCFDIRLNKTFEIVRNISLNMEMTSNVSSNNSLRNQSDQEPDGPLSDDSEAGLIVLFSLTTLLAIVGNSFVVLVFARGRRSRTDLRPFLINLAVADLIMALFCMPFTFIYTMLENWIFSKPMCPIVLFVQLLSVSGSVFTNMAIGIDRFLVVMFPLRSRLTKKKAKYVICGIWICSTALSCVQFKVGHGIDLPNGNIVCQEVWNPITARHTYTVFLFVITYVIPLIILSITYSIVGILLWKRTSPGNRDFARDMQQLRSKRKVRHYFTMAQQQYNMVLSDTRNSPSKSKHTKTTSEHA